MTKHSRWCARVGVVSLAYLASARMLEVDEAAAAVSNHALSAARPADRAALALRWAPIHYQATDHTGSHALRGASDYIARYDFDGDLNARNNFDNAGNPSYPLSAHGYHSVVETSSHWFIVYMFFHPRDWVDTPFDQEHENDSEGVLLAVRRDGSRYGKLQAAVTVAHSDFYSFVPSGSSWTANAESVDGTLPLETCDGARHPVTAQQAQGHGLKARPHYDIEANGIVYYPSSSVAEVPSSYDDRQVRYKLLDIFVAGGLWDQRSNRALFASLGSFAGDASGGCGAGLFGCRSNAANAPWGWDDSDDGAPRGALATDPAGLLLDYFRVPEGMSRAYTYNPYR